MADHRGEISLCQDKTGPGGGRDLQILVEGRSERGRRVCRGYSQFSVCKILIFLSSPWLFRDILESVLGDRVEHLLHLGSSRHQFGQNSLHRHFRSLSARTAKVEIIMKVNEDMRTLSTQFSTHSMGRSDMSEVNFFCLGRGLVCFLNSVLI